MIRLLIVLLLLLTPFNVYAEAKEIIAEGTYNMGDGETPSIAEERALINAKRNAIEQSGTYLETLTEVINHQLTRDEIRTLSSGLLKTTILEKSRTVQPKGGIYFWVKIKATVISDNLPDIIDRVKSMRASNRYQTVETLYSTLQAETIKQQTQIQSNEKSLLANKWLDEGLHYVIAGNYKSAKEALQKSLAIKPSRDAQILMGDACFLSKDYANAISFYEGLPLSEEIAWKLSVSSEKVSKNWDAIIYMAKITGAVTVPGYSTSPDLDGVIVERNIATPELNPSDYNAWYRLGCLFLKEEAYRNLKYKKAFFCFNRVTELTNKIPAAYYLKGRILEEFNKPYEAAQEYKLFLKTATETTPNYENAQDRLQELHKKYGISY